jgi:hypothetical protein
MYRKGKELLTLIENRFTMLSEKLFEDILVKYTELIEDKLTFIGRQVTYFGKRIDILFEDRFKEKLVVELKIGNLQRAALSQVLEYEGYILSEKDPTARVMIIANRIPLNLKKAMDHHGIEYKEITLNQLRQFLEKRDDELLKAIIDQPRIVSQIEVQIRNNIIEDNIGKQSFADGDGITDNKFNPFSVKEWIYQRYPLTQNRKEQLAPLFGKAVETILRINPVNYGKYVAFVGIRWGFAVISGGILTETEKWNNRIYYDDYGNLIKNVDIKIHKNQRITKKSVCLEYISRKGGGSLYEMAKAIVDRGIDPDFEKNVRVCRLWMSKIGVPVKKLENGNYIKSDLS